MSAAICNTLLLIAVGIAIGFFAHNALLEGFLSRKKAPSFDEPIRAPGNNKKLEKRSVVEEGERKEAVQQQKQKRESLGVGGGGSACPPVQPPPELQEQRTPPLHSATAHALRFLPQLVCGTRCDCFHVRWMVQAEGESAWEAADAVWESPWVAVQGLRADTLYAVAVWVRPHARAATGDMRWYRALPAKERTCPERAPRVRRLRARAQPGSEGARVEVRWVPPLPEGCHSALLVMARLALTRGLLRGAGGDDAQMDPLGDGDLVMPEWRLIGGYRVGGDPYGQVQECVDWPGQHCVDLLRPYGVSPRVALLAQVYVLRRGEEGSDAVSGWRNREAPPVASSSSSSYSQAWVEPEKLGDAEGEDETRWDLAPHPDVILGRAGQSVSGVGDAIGLLLLLLAGVLLLMLLGASAIAACVYKRRRRRERKAAQLAALVATDDGLISAWNN